jgi:hypothetical protein
MSPALIVAILMAGGGADGAGDGQTTGGAAMVSALTEALGPGTSVVVEYVSTPSEAAAMRLQQVAHAAAVATVAEDVPGRSGASVGARRSIRVRIHLQSGAWRSLQLTFPPGEDALERGRSIGLAVAATILSNAPSPVGASRGDLAAADTSTAPVSSESSAAVSSPEPSTEPAISTERGPAEVSAEVGDSAPPLAPIWPLSTARARHAIELVGLGSAGVAGPAGGLGLAVHLERAGRAAPTTPQVFWARVGGGFRSGSVAGLNGDQQVAWATLGGAWRLPARTAAARTPGSPFGIAIALDLGVLVQVLSHRQSTGEADRRVRALPEGSLGLAATWRIGGAWEAHAGLGLELALGHTEVWVAQSYLTTIPMLRALATLGLRFDL